MSEQVQKKVKKSEINISSKLCTGCRICVEMCPADVLEMLDAPDRVAGQMAKVKNRDACTQCMLCEIHCPEFAITVTVVE